MTLRIFVPPAAVLALVALVGTNPSAPAAPDGPAGDADIAVQARGPIHEGYARPFDAAPRPGPVAPKAPPDPVPEVPPDQKPEGDNVQWVPGYWSWDGDRNDYTWVSGFWRAAPPDRKWTAGYWRKTGDGWQWVAGYWAPARQERPPLLDEPPEPLEAGPSVPAPDERSLYVPGSWVPRDERYAWRPGYWRPARLGWVWVPAQYVWTPGGCVYVDGYWDYPLETRGVLFAPVVFERPLWRAPGWCFRPRFTVCVDTSFFAALFVRPSCGQYCFGDYYDSGYLTAGYEPWCRYGPRHHDPLFGYYRWSHRDDPGWLRGVGAAYAGRRAGDLARPPRTLAEQGSGRRAAPAVVRPLSDFRGGLKLAAIDRAQVGRHQAAAQQIQDAARQRVQAERFGTRGRPTAAPVVVHQPADHAAPRHNDARAAAPVIEHPAAPERHVSPPPHVAAPVVVHKPAAPPPPPIAAPRRPVSPPPPPVAAPSRHVSPPPAHVPAPHVNPPAHHSTPPPAHAPAHSNGGNGGHNAGGHRKK